MTAHDAARTWWLRSRRRPVDDAYTAWFGAHSRCTQLLPGGSRESCAKPHESYRADRAWRSGASRIAFDASGARPYVGLHG